MYETVAIAPIEFPASATRVSSRMGAAGFGGFVAGFLRGSTRMPLSVTRVIAWPTNHRTMSCWSRHAPPN
jgi:hypothetical protein